MLTYKITKQISKENYQQIMQIRKEHYYENFYDDKYWQGGIISLLNEETIANSHFEDCSSVFLLIYDEESNIVAYSRYSVNCIEYNGTFISKLHIFICKKQYLSKKFEISNDTDSHHVKLGKYMLDKILDHCKREKTSILISEICVFPYPNLPSLSLHCKSGFKSIGKSLKIVPKEEVEIQFIILAKHILDKKMNYLDFPYELFS